MNSNNGYLFEPYITDDCSSVCVWLHGLRESGRSKDYSIILSHSWVLIDDFASDLSNMAFLCCLGFYVGLSVVISRPG